MYAARRIGSGLGKLGLIFCEVHIDRDYDRRRAEIALPHPAMDQAQ
jgi:hypothetical protein